MWAGLLRIEVDACTKLPFAVTSPIETLACFPGAWAPRSWGLISSAR